MLFEQMLQISTPPLHLPPPYKDFLKNLDVRTAPVCIAAQIIAYSFGPKFLLSFVSQYMVGLISTMKFSPFPTILYS